MTVVYATLDDMLAAFTEAELIQLTDENLTGTIDQAKMDKALASASALVDGYVAATYNLDPAAPVPILLVDATCDIARYRLFKQSPSEDATTRNAQAIRTLEGIRSGKIKLDTGAEAIPPREGKILTQGGVRRMSRQQTEGY